MSSTPLMSLDSLCTATNRRVIAEQRLGQVKSSRIVEPGYFDLKGLSDYSGGGLSVRTLRKLLSIPGGLPHFRVGGKILVGKKDFDTWMQRHRQEPLNLDSVVEEVLKDLNL